MLKDFFRKEDELDCPLKLNQKNATFEDIGLHAELRQRLKNTTVDKYLRYARFMANHKIPIDFNNLDYTQFIRHMDYREREENATPDALKHEWKVMRMFLRAYHIENWSYKAPPAPKPAMRVLPFPEKVNEFFNFKYSKNRYETKLYQYLFFFGFLIGVRPPSEIVELKLSDVFLEDHGRSYLIITEPKKYKSKRVVVPEKQIILYHKYKSLKNYIDIWRPRVENQYSDDALFLRPDGRPFTSEYLRYKLSKHGKRVWSHYCPSDMRHWCAIARLIKNKVDLKFFDVYSIKNWLGHEKMSTTEGYIKYAEQYYREYPVDWISYALRNRKSK